MTWEGGMFSVNSRKRSSRLLLNPQREQEMLLVKVPRQRVSMMVGDRARRPREGLIASVSSSSIRSSRKLRSSSASCQQR